jgi:hypothetical protein
MMSFCIEISFEGSCRIREYQWATNPSDDQVDEIVDELELHRYSIPAKIIIKALRDSAIPKMSSGNLTVTKI